MQSLIHVCVDCLNQLFQVDGHVERSWQSTNIIIEISCVNSNNLRFRFRIEFIKIWINEYFWSIFHFSEYCQIPSQREKNFLATSPSSTPKDPTRNYSDLMLNKFLHYQCTCQKLVQSFSYKKKIDPFWG